MMVSQMRKKNTHNDEMNSLFALTSVEFYAQRSPYTLDTAEKIKKNWRHSPTTTGKVSRSFFFCTFSSLLACNADSDRCSAMFSLTTTQWRPAKPKTIISMIFGERLQRKIVTAFVPGKRTSTRVLWKWARNGSLNCVLFGVFSTRIVVVTITLSQHFLLLFSFVFSFVVAASFAHNTLQYYFIA